jgi:hypothetical protein
MKNFFLILAQADFADLVPPAEEPVSKLEILAAKLPGDNSQMRSFW